jgi:hypothetical protein
MTLMIQRRKRLEPAPRSRRWGFGLQRGIRQFEDKAAERFLVTRLEANVVASLDLIGPRDEIIEG